MFPAVALKTDECHIVWLTVANRTSLPLMFKPVRPVSDFAVGWTAWNCLLWSRQHTEKHYS